MENGHSPFPREWCPLLDGESRVNCNLSFPREWKMVIAKSGKTLCTFQPENRSRFMLKKNVDIALKSHISGIFWKQWENFVCYITTVGKQKKIHESGSYEQKKLLKAVKSYRWGRWRNSLAVFVVSLLLSVESIWLMEVQCAIYTHISDIAHSAIRHYWKLGPPALHRSRKTISGRRDEHSDFQR